jgi:pimeloyl-[acyl-carrier protein] methyl ester esterase
MAGADIVFLFGSFRHFHPEEDGPAKERSREILQGMRKALVCDPRKVIASFRRRCEVTTRGGAMAGRRGGSPGRESRSIRRSDAIAKSDLPLNIALLAADLDRLDSEEVDFTLLREVPRILVFHGTGDRIVPLARGEELARFLGGRATFFSIEGAGHALPFTHVDEIMRLVAPLMAPPAAR